MVTKNIQPTKYILTKKTSYKIVSRIKPLHIRTYSKIFITSTFVILIILAKKMEPIKVDPYLMCTREMWLCLCFGHT